MTTCKISFPSCSRIQLKRKRNRRKSLQLKKTFKSKEQAIQSLVQVYARWGWTNKRQVEFKKVKEVLLH